jgi:hypothetical protein
MKAADRDDDAARIGEYETAPGAARSDRAARRRVSGLGGVKRSRLTHRFPRRGQGDRLILRRA